MSWKKFFTPVPVGRQSSSYSPLTSTQRAGPARTNYSSFLPDVYTGSPNRIERYLQYDTMDMDSEVNAALDILAEFSSQKNRENSTPFTLTFKNKATNSEVSILREYLQQWVKLQKFETRIFRIVRNAFKYGDVFFIRDPETSKWFYLDPAKIVKIIVNESEGKEPEQYVIRDLNPKFSDMVVTAINPNTTNSNNRGTAYVAGGQAARGMTGAYPSSSSSASRFETHQDEVAIDADNIIHLSLSEGLDNNYPFGVSLLENVFKVFKQKELLEDAILIYRIQRAPERRIFYIDVGNMPSHLAMSFVERVKNEIHQRRIPSSVGGANNVIDSAYNPLCLDLNTRVPLLDGRTLTISELIAEFESGKENWAYSCNPETGEVVPGVINWAGVTRKNAEVIKITLDNGKELIVTPDHKIPVFGKGFVEAKDLTVDDSLISFNRRRKKISSNGNEYEQVWDHGTKTWVWTHRKVGEFFRQRQKHQEFTYLPENIGRAKSVIHHKDTNRFNNDPRNLCYMNQQDHILYHASQKKDFWENMSDQYRLEMSSKISNTLKENWKNLSESDRLAALWNLSRAREKAVWMRQNDPTTMASHRQRAPASRKKYIDDHPAFKAQLLENLESRVKIKNQTLNLTFDMLQRVAEKVKNGENNKHSVISLCDNDPILLGMVKRENSESLDYKNAHCGIDFLKFGYSKLNRLLKKFGYKNWKTFVKEVENFNHRIVKIESVENRDTGTITIDGTERWHGFHTFAVDSGIFVKNSINEDFFFPTTAEGRGSKVETLPGGCLAMDTLVPLLDGRKMTISDLADACRRGETNWVFSCCPDTGKIVPGIISWAGVTQTHTEVMRIEFSNGQHIICTPDHKFPIKGSGIQRADQLCVGSVMTPYAELTDRGQEFVYEVDAWIPRTEVIVNMAMDEKFNESLIHMYQQQTAEPSHWGDGLWQRVRKWWRDLTQVTVTITSIEYLDEPMTVGTLTIDAQEQYYRHHNFAVCAGVFTQNSNLGEIDDLRFFTNKLFRGLRIPSSYLPTGSDDSQSQYNDGRVGTAYIQELRFNNYCIRLQSLLQPAFDQEFKLYLYNRGVNIDSALFDLELQPPQNFASYRQAELDNQRINTYSTISAQPYISKRFALMRYLGLSEEEVAENERLWSEENGLGVTPVTNSSGEMRGIGVSQAGLQTDLGNMTDTVAPPDMTVPGMEQPAAPGAMAAAPQPGGMQPGASPPMM